MKLNVAICDDDEIICSLMENMILSYSKENFIDIDIDIFHSGEKLIHHITKEYGVYDLIYLDIEMAKLNGIEVGYFIRNTLKDHKAQIVYVSGKNQYDRQLFDVQPLLFISKPIDESKLISSITLAMEKLTLTPKLFQYKKRKEYFNVLLDDIIYFRNSGRYVNIFTVHDMDTFVGSIRDVAQAVLANGFIQISQSVIVNYNFVSKYSREEIILINRERIAIPKHKRNGVKERFLRESDKYL